MSRPPRTSCGRCARDRVRSRAPDLIGRVAAVPVERKSGEIRRWRFFRPSGAAAADCHFARPQARSGSLAVRVAVTEGGWWGAAVPAWTWDVPCPYGLRGGSSVCAD
jgi:hypothetical protein